ncbi:MAG TPA: META domain-containing protein [Acidimicrobiales bacterium]
MRTTRTTLRLLGLVIAAVATAMVVGACGSDDSSGSAATAGEVEGNWILESFTVDGDEATAQQPAATISFAADGAFSGSTPCNGMSGTWTDDDGALTLELGPMTMRACEDTALQAQETAITTGFPKVTAANVSDETLELTGEGVAFRFTRGPDGIVGSYKVTGVNNGADAVVSSAATETITIDFAEDGTVSGNAGCNRFSGTYEQDGTALTIQGNVATTMMACDEDATTAEQQFLTALAAVTTWSRNGQPVTLSDSTGATQLTLVPAA